MTPDTQDIFTIALLYFTSFFSLINPLGSMPVFLTMTSNLNKKERSRTAIKAVFTAFITLMIFAFGGQMLFQFFGISVNSFKVVGGIIFFMMGYDMLNARLSSLKNLNHDEAQEYVDDISITPLGIPMIAGPGAITNSIVLMQESDTFTLKLLLVGIIVFTMLLTLVIYLGGSTIVRFLGETGNKIMLKLMGLIVMVIAVEFFFAGLTPILRGILNI
ncbi:MAG: antibiotic resistance protein MarC [Bacteroidetes bacterium 4572_77]|nr:MAG: antibiotic resistance protein MarC [Bacteroidetes bacterium 4572_77]